MKYLIEKELRNVRAEIRGGLLKRWEREASVIWNVFSCLHPAERLFAEIHEWERDWEWVLALPEGDEDLGVGDEAHSRRSALRPPDRVNQDHAHTWAVQAGEP